MTVGDAKAATPRPTVKVIFQSSEREAFTITDKQPWFQLVPLPIYASGYLEQDDSLLASDGDDDDDAAAAAAATAAAAGGLMKPPATPPPAPPSSPPPSQAMEEVEEDHIKT